MCKKDALSGGAEARTQPPPWGSRLASQGGAAILPLFCKGFPWMTPPAHTQGTRLTKVYNIMSTCKSRSWAAECPGYNPRIHPLQGRVQFLVTTPRPGPDVYSLCVRPSGGPRETSRVWGWRVVTRRKSHEGICHPAGEHRLWFAEMS